jgi:hypothetical protein
MEVSGQLYASAALLPTNSPVPIRQEAGWAPELVWALWRRENIAVPGIETG